MLVFEIILIISWNKVIVDSDFKIFYFVMDIAEFFSALSAAILVITLSKIAELEVQGHIYTTKPVTETNLELSCNDQHSVDN